MKRFLIATLALLAAVAAGWSALWFTGQSEITERIELERERLASQGIFVSLEGAPEIDGFPFGYRARTGPMVVDWRASGVSMILPDLTAEVDATRPGHLRMTFPESFDLRVPAPALLQTPSDGAAAGSGEGEGAAAVPPAEPTFVNIAVEAEAMVLEEERGEGAPPRTALTARSILAVHAAPGQHRNAAVELRALDAELIRPAGPAGAMDGRFTLTAEALDFLSTGMSETGQPVTFETEILGISIGGKSDQRSLAGLVSVIAGAPGGGRLDLAVQTGETRIAGGAASGEDGSGGGSVSMTSGASGLSLKVADGMIDMTSNVENNRLAIDAVRTDTAQPVKGAVTIARAETVYRAPVAPSEEMRAFVMRVAAGAITADDAFWSGIDPEGALRRDPGEIVIDVAGTSRVLAPSSVAGGPAEFELGNLTLRHGDVTLLGSAIRVGGDIEFLQPGNTPQGTLEVSLIRALQLVPELVRAGLLSVQEAQLVLSLANEMTDVGDEPDELELDITFEGDLILLNGLPLGTFGLR